MFARLRRRLLLVNALTIAGIVALLAAGIVLLLDRVLLDQQTAELGESARAAIEQLGGDDRDRALPGSDEGTFYVLWGTNGDVVSNPASMPADQLRPAAQEAVAGHAGTRTLRLGSVEALVASEPIVSGGQVVGAVQAGRSLAQVRDIEGRVVALVLGVGSAALLLSLLAAWLLAERALIPIRRAFQRQQEFTADASHELRTPLSVVDAGVQLLARHPDESIGANNDVLESMAVQVAHMESVVGALLTLARADAGAAEIAPVELDADELIGSTAESMRPFAEANGAALSVGALGAGMVQADPDRVRELVTILVANAVTHGGRGVAIAVAARRAGRSWILEVSDDGPGIPPAERTRVLERFYRSEAARTTPGTGLGLAIADWIASAHGGRLALLDNAAAARPGHGPGVLARVTLPVAVAG